MLGNGIVPAGIQRVAARDAPYRQPAAVQRTVRANGGNRIVRAAGIETTARPEQWADQDLVAADEEDEAGGEAVTEEAAIRVHSRSRLRRICGAVSVRLPGLARMTRSTAGSFR